MKNRLFFFIANRSRSTAVEYVLDSQTKCDTGYGRERHGDRILRQQLLNMLHQQRSCALVYASAAVVFLALSAVAIPLFGILGAAGAMLAALMVETYFLAFVARHRLGLQIFIWHRPRGEVGTSNV